MTTPDFREQCMALIDQLLAPGFEHPIAFARYLLPIHLLLVDPQGRVAYGVIDASGAASVRLLP
jgi:hypothetical protein